MPGIPQGNKSSKIAAGEIYPAISFGYTGCLKHPFCNGYSVCYFINRKKHRLTRAQVKKI
jgi:hypothetical protein